MLSKFKTESEILLLDPDLDIESRPGRKRVVLSPALYWVRAFELPVKSEKEAKKLLPSLFEEFLPEGDFHYYGYFEEGGRYIGFAYEEEKIRALATKKGVDPVSIEAIHFAQSELSPKMLPAKLSNEWILTSIDGIVVKLPRDDEKETKPLDLTALHPSKKSIKIERYKTPIEKKSLYSLSAIALAFAMLYTLQWYRLDQEKRRLQQLSEKIFQKYSLLPTMTQNRSILKKYEKIDKRQKKLRKTTAALLKIPQYAGGSLQSITFEKGTLHAVYKDLQNRSTLQKRLHIFEPKIQKLKNGTLAVKVTL